MFEKYSLAKAAGAEVAVQQRHEKWHAAVSRKSKCTKHLSAGPICPEKWHAAVTRSTFASQNHKTHGFGPLFDVPIWKNGTPLWREAHL